MPAEVRPYLVPGPGAVHPEGWSWAVDGTWEPLPEALPDWDPAMPLHLRRVVHLDTDRITADTGLPPDATLALTVSWTSSDTSMREAAPPVPVERPGTRTVVLAASPVSERLGGTVTLRTTLALTGQPGPRTAGIAHAPGSILAEDTHRFALTDRDPPFPVHQIDFARTRLDEAASWHLQTSTDLDAPFLGAFLLLLNTRDTELLAAVARGRRDGRQQLLVDELEHGVATLMLELAALHAPDLAERDTWPEGTVGDALTRVLQGAGQPPAPTGPHDLATARTALAAAARNAGHGRQLR